MPHASERGQREAGAGGADPAELELQQVSPQGHCSWPGHQQLRVRNQTRGSTLDGDPYLILWEHVFRDVRDMVGVGSRATDPSRVTLGLPVALPFLLWGMGTAGRRPGAPGGAGHAPSLCTCPPSRLRVLPTSPLLLPQPPTLGSAQNSSSHLYPHTGPRQVIFHPFVLHTRIEHLQCTKH